jgi:hypothetical protein
MDSVWMRKSWREKNWNEDGNNSRYGSERKKNQSHNRKNAANVALTEEKNPSGFK